MTTDKYILVGKKIRKCPDLMEWAKFMGEGLNRIVKQENVMAQEGVVTRHIHISTVFLGLDHNWSDKGAPILFETMTFGGIKNDQSICERCCTWEEAEAQHKRVKQYVLGKIKSL